MSYRRLKTQKHSVSTGLFCSIFFFFFILIVNLLKHCFLFCLGQLLLKTFYMSLHSTKRKAWKRRRLSGSFGCWWTWAYLILIFIKVQELQIVFRVTQTFDVFVFLKKIFCLMSGQKFTLFDAKLLLPDDLFGLKNIYSDLSQSHEFSKNEQMQMVFTTE